MLASLGIVRQVCQPMLQRSFRPRNEAKTIVSIVSRSFSSTDNSTINNQNPQEEYQKEISDIETQYEERKKRRQSMIGVVVSDKCTKTVTIKVEREKYFPKYDKHVTRSRKFMAHDEEEKCDIGDVIRIVPCRPISKMKRHMVIDVLKKGQQLDLSAFVTKAAPAVTTATVKQGGAKK